MALTFKIDSVEKFTALDVRNDISLPEQKASVAAFVQAGIDEAKATNRSILGRVPPFTVTVDGRQGAPLETVNPDGGSIIVEFELVGNVLDWIRQTLMERSPVGPSGRYKNYHFLYADNLEVAASEDPPPASEYIFLNPLPYTRKIEIGKTKAGRDFVISVPNRIYERTARDAKSRFGNVANIRFVYSSLSDVGATPIGQWARSGAAYALSRRAGRRTKSIAWLTRVPAISVTLGKE